MMKTRLASAILLSTASALVAQTKPASAPPAPPAFTPVRWNEDYSYLKTAPHTDFWDPIKYIPLNEEGDWYLSLGGQARYRYEWFDNFNFGAPGQQDGNGYHLGRVLGHVDAHFGPHVRGFVQVIAAGVDGRDPGERNGIDENDFDFHQAFVDLKLPLADKSLTLRGGRQNLLYGAQRLISPLDWTNTRRTFDGGKASLALSKTHILDAFYVNPVVVDEGPIDQSSDDDFAGIYDTIGLPDVLKGAGSKLELYALYLDKLAATFAEGTGAEERYTVGGRFYTNPKPWDLDVEAAYQFGEFADGDISAWMFATEAGYTFADQSLTPRLYLGFDVASGDDDPNDGDLQTFNQLFPLGHSYFGYIDVIGRQNIIDVHPGIELTLAQDKRHVKKLSLRTDYHLFWRYSDQDALYGVAGGIQRASGGSSAAYVGSELDILLNWQIDRHTAAYFGYSHFFAGDFIDETGPNEDIDFVYAAVTYTF
ncbi:MAG: alginate export family protein [Tepidisphaeraceae bacterium]